ncbi:hypothetical protein ES332_D04G196200v1 [Gossypium tomentosum]|uniref:Uncharacterized protein n=1 Tax=Gossypium tomentosum TaxID=34277 RepID=A0A5D2LFS8_GOSTO|nr:hypothetical protein ES332_D04G196200v1 [Gossypium tomentosum]
MVLDADEERAGSFRYKLRGTYVCGGVACAGEGLAAAALGAGCC